MDNSLLNYKKFTNPKYQVGGRWSGFFKPKAGAVGELGQPVLLTTSQLKHIALLK